MMYIVVLIVYGFKLEHHFVKSLTLEFWLGASVYIANKKIQILVSWFVYWWLGVWGRLHIEGSHMLEIYIWYLYLATDIPSWVDDPIEF